MHFLLDENLSHTLVDRLIAAGHGADSVDLLRMKGSPDEELLWFAKTRDWVFVSIDEDYLLLHRAFRRWGVTRMHAGILILPDLLPPLAQTRTLDIFASEGLPIADQLYIWDTTQGGAGGHATTHRSVICNCDDRRLPFREHIRRNVEPIPVATGTTTMRTRACRWHGRRAPFPRHRAACDGG
jgi:hypothetical protein